MKLVSKLLFTSLFLLVVAIAARPSVASAHADSEPLWAMNKYELADLEKTIAEHRLKLLQAMNEAIQYGLPSADAQRAYRFDSSREVVDIPRSVLNRVIMASLELETASMKMYLACGEGCEHSLEKDLGDVADKKEAAGVIRGLWPKMKASFAILWKDIPVGVWMRTINAARYSRSIFANARYQAKAYGGLSMTMGAAAFGGAFAVTEVLETMFMGPLHFVCKANYFWSVAFGAAVAGLSRDLKTLLLFEKDQKSIARRMLQAFSNFASLKNAQRIEKRILFKSLAGSSADQFLKVSKREAHSSVLEPMLDKISGAQAVAVDPLMWAELVASANPHLKAKRFRLAGGANEKIFEFEVDRILDPNLTAAQARARWQDMSASMRVVLRMLRNGVAVAQQLHGDRAEQLRALGLLDMQLRTLDLFILSWLEKRAGRVGHGEAEISAEWLRNAATEWMALAIETTAPDADLRAVELKRNNLKAILVASIRRGEPIAVTPEGPRDFQRAVLDEIPKVREALASAGAIRTCDALFTPVLE